MENNNLKKTDLNNKIIKENNWEKEKKFIEKISNTFWLNEKTAKELSKLKQISLKEDLIKEIDKIKLSNKWEKEKIEKINIEELLQIFEKEKKQINNNILTELDNFRIELNKVISKNTSFSEDKFRDFFNKAKNPNNLFENIYYWTLAWSLSSIEKISKNTYKLIIDFFKLIPDIINNFEDIKENIKKI